MIITIYNTFSKMFNNKRIHFFAFIGLLQISIHANAVDFYGLDFRTIRDVTKTGPNSFSTNTVATRSLYGNIINYVAFDPMMNRMWGSYNEGGDPMGIASVNNISGILMTYDLGAIHFPLGIDKAGENSKLYLTSFSDEIAGNFILKRFDLMALELDSTSFSAYTTDSNHTFNNYRTNTFFAKKDKKIYQRSDNDGGNTWVVIDTEDGSFDSTFFVNTGLYESLAYNEKNHRIYALADSTITMTNEHSNWSGKKRPKLVYIDLDTVSNPVDTVDVGTSIGAYGVTKTSTFVTISPANNMFWVSNAFEDISGTSEGDEKVIGIDLDTGEVAYAFAQSSSLGDVLPTGDPIIYTDVDLSLTDSLSAGILTKLGTGTLTYTGTNNSSEGVAVTQGTLKVEGGTQLGSGAVNLEGGELELSSTATLSNVINTTAASTLDTSTNTVTLSGTISGSSALTKAGSGILKITGTLSNTGGFNVTAGELNVNNSSGTSPTTVSGGTLSGAGTIGTLTASSGTIAPGNSIGTLNVSGNVTLGSSNILVIEVDADGNSDKIVATGSVTAGGTLKISPETSETYSGVTYTIITGSSISGTFTTTEITTCSGVTPSVSYGSTSITVTLSGCVTTGSKNYSAVSSYFNDLTSSGDMATIKSAINGLSGDSYTNAIKALDYNTVGAINKVSFKHNDLTKNIINQRLAISNNNSSAMNKVSYINQSNDKSFFNFKQIFTDLEGVDGWWSKFYGGTTDRETENFIGNNGYDDDYYGMVFGLDGKQGNKITGITLSVQEGNIQGNNSEGDTDYTSFNISPYYALKNEDGSGYAIQTNVQVMDVSSDRFLRFGSINRTAKGDYTNYSIGANVDYSFKIISVSNFNIDSKINVSYQYNHQESFTERGADSLNIHVKKNDYQLASVGFSELVTSKADNEFKPFISLSGSYNSYLSDTDSKQNFQNQTSSYVTKIDKNNWMSGSIKTGFVKHADNKESYLVIGYTRSYKEKDLYLQLGLSIDF